MEVTTSLLPWQMKVDCLFLYTEPHFCGILASYIWEGGCGTIFPVLTVCVSQGPVHIQIDSACALFLLLAAIILRTPPPFQLHLIIPYAGVPPQLWP